VIGILDPDSYRGLCTLQFCTKIRKNSRFSFRCAACVAVSTFLTFQRYVSFGRNVKYNKFFVTLEQRNVERKQNFLRFNIIFTKMKHFATFRSNETWNAIFLRGTNETWNTTIMFRSRFARLTPLSAVQKNQNILRCFIIPITFFCSCCKKSKLIFLLPNNTFFVHG
jgi:hypothetical protein